MNIEAPSHLTALLNVPPRSPLTEVLFTAHDGNKPHSLAHIYVPRDLAQSDQPAATPSPKQVPVRLVDSQPLLVEVQERLSARLPTAEEATALRISSCLAVLSLTRVAIDATGRVVEAAILVLPGDRADALFTTRLNPEERTPKV
ncbi:hypothetical protein Slala04_32630 [Streptomyces lavendulae subsp. lavendulae]|nr:hypothetical protein Slala04_32630 [Streptomyces lavendulae subsp. lavendulae]